jgi:hypothetical protein
VRIQWSQEVDNDELHLACDSWEDNYCDDVGGRVDVVFATAGTGFAVRRQDHHRSRPQDSTCIRLIQSSVSLIGCASFVCLVSF